MYFSYQLTFDSLVSPLDKCILIVLTSFEEEKHSVSTC